MAIKEDGTTQPPTTGDTDDSSRRNYQRVEIAIPGRFMTPDGAEHDCSVRDFSLNGIAFECSASVRPGDHIVAYVEDLGRFEGPVTRRFVDGFAMRMKLTEPRKERLAMKVEHRAGSVGDGDDSSQPAPAIPGKVGRGSTLTLDDGRSAPCRVVDMSTTGAQVLTYLRPGKGAMVSIGRMRGHVIHYTRTGIVVAFEHVPENPNATALPNV